MPRFARANSFFSERRPSRERLAKLVREMTAARHEQLLLDRVAASLLGALVAAVVWVAVARFVLTDQHPGAGVGVLLVVALLAALSVSRARRPDELRVAIESDIELGLQQTLSTAWELETRHAEPALVERLAAQAMSAQGLPRLGERVFPWRANRAARLLPLAALMLLLVSVLAPFRQHTPELPPADAILAQVGERLRDHGQAMQRTAQREGLARSAAKAQDMQRLGSHMRDGLLTRPQALVRLRELDAGLAEQRLLAAGESPLPPDSLGGRATSATRQGRELQELLDKLAAGSLNTTQFEDAARLAVELAVPLISPQDLQSALRRLEDGDPEALRELLQQLSRIDTANREIEELELADDEVRRARESLGDADDIGDRRLTAVEGDPRDGDTVRFARDEARRPGAVGVQGIVYRPAQGYGGENTGESVSDTRPRQAAEDARGVLRPRGQPGEGAVRQSQARVLPRAGETQLHRLGLERDFVAQIEEVLSKEEVPLHQKELIRRYFNSLDSGPGDTR